MFPVVQHSALFKKHPELLDWYHTNIGRPLESIQRMEMTEHDGKTHIWIYFKDDIESVGYRSFLKSPDGRFIPADY
jgi:hypothetical protein